MARATSGPVPTPRTSITRASFVQLELAGRIGLPEGRYLVREDDVERVLIVQELEAPRPQRRGRRRPRPVEPGGPEQVPVTRVTVTGVSFEDASSGSAWLKRTIGDRERGTQELRDAARIVNRALSAVRVEARDPLVQDIGVTRALAIRLGHGTGDELAEGRWTEASQLPQARGGRLDEVDPQSRVAAVLAGRDRVHPAETLIQRARLDVQQGRDAEARYGLQAARAALREEPGPRRGQLLEELAAIEERLS
ncbi:MAG TPA: hypothetical protein VHR38_05225 [Solirubrobacterales bacterium]|jgi:hypothetical protein|nr:hypothetical protein [Solirubrobacterales bacterium]